MTFSGSRKPTTKLGGLAYVGFLRDRQQGMESFFPAVRSMGNLSGSERRVFDAMLLICNESLPMDLDGSGVLPRHSRRFNYSALDETLLGACIRLLERGHIPDAGLEAMEIHNRQLHGRQFGVRAFCPRSHQFLQEVAIMQTSRLIALKALASSPFPPETVQMVCDEVVRLHNIPAARNAFLNAWKSVMPTITFCHRRACISQTCSERTRVKWLPKERRWAYRHVGLDYTASVWCKRRSCEGHHDEDFATEDWNPPLRERSVSEEIGSN